MNRWLDSLGMPPAPVLGATLIGWGIIAYVVFARTVPLVVHAVHVIHQVTAALS